MENSASMRQKNHFITKRNCGDSFLPPQLKERFNALNV